MKWIVVILLSLLAALEFLVRVIGLLVLIAGTLFLAMFLLFDSCVTVDDVLKPYFLTFAEKVALR